MQASLRPQTSVYDTLQCCEELPTGLLHRHAHLGGVLLDGQCDVRGLGEAQEVRHSGDESTLLLAGEGNDLPDM